MGWKIALLYITCLTGVCLTSNVEQAVVQGKIKFIGKDLQTIPKGSCLIIKINDERLADAPSVNIATKTYRSKDLQVKSGSLSYSIAFKQAQGNVEYSISATLNMGWCSLDNRDDGWIRGGDYLTTTSYNIELKQETHLYKKDIDAEYYETLNVGNHHQHHKDDHMKYRGDAKKTDDPCQHALCYNSICISYPNGSYHCKKLEMMPCAVPMCADIYQPVCGSNGKTYPNECVMDGDSCYGGVKTGLHKVHDGECYSSNDYSSSNYSKRGLHEGFLLGAGAITMATLGLIVVFLVWRRNRQRKFDQVSPREMKKVAPLDM